MSDFEECVRCGERYDNPAEPCPKGGCAAVPYHIARRNCMPSVGAMRAEILREAVDHPSHYNAHPSGVECITVVEHMTFNVGSAVKYLWRAGLKDSEPALTDLKKSAWYIAREIERVEKAK